MEQLGEVKAILNENMLLISSSKELKINEIVTVFSLVKDKRLVESIGKEQIVFPKGEIQIICKQSDNVYLAERFREFSERRSKVSKPGPLAKAFLGIGAQFQAETREVVEKVPGPWSAEFDSDQILKISPSKTVMIKDMIGRI